MFELETTGRPVRLTVDKGSKLVSFEIELLLKSSIIFENKLQRCTKV